MGMGRGNRPVSIIVASGLLGLDGELSDVRSAEPCARGPPSSVRVRTRATRGLRVRHGEPAGEDLPVQGPEKGEATHPTSLLPRYRTRKASPSYS